MRFFLEQLDNFAAGAALIAYLFVVTIGDFTVPEVAKVLILPALVLGAGWKLVGTNGRQQE